LEINKSCLDCVFHRVVDEETYNPKLIKTCIWGSQDDAIPRTASDSPSGYYRPPEGGFVKKIKKINEMILKLNSERPNWFELIETLSPGKNNTRLVPDDHVFSDCKAYIAKVV